MEVKLEGQEFESKSEVLRKIQRYLELAVVSGVVAKEQIVIPEDAQQAVAGAEDAQKLSLQLAVMDEAERTEQTELYNLAGALEARSQWKPAADIYDQLLEKTETAELLFRKATCLLQLNKRKEAKSLLVQAIELDSEVGEYHSSLAQVLNAEKRYEEEIAALEKAVKLKQGKADWFYRLALAYIRQRYWGKAESTLVIAAELNAGVAEYFNKLAGVRQNLGKTIEECEALQRAVELDNRHASWHQRLGDTLLKQRRYAEAVPAYRGAISLRENEVEWYYRLGLCLERSGDKEGAQEAYRQVEERDSLAVGRYHESYEQWDLAVEAYSEELRKGNKGWEVYRGLALARERLHCWKEAAEAYERLIELEPEQTLWRYRLGFVVERWGNLVRADQVYRDAEQSIRATGDGTSLEKQERLDFKRYETALDILSLGLGQQARRLLARIGNPTGEMLLLTAKTDFLASRYEDAEYNALRSMAKLSLKTEREPFKEAYYTRIEALRALGRHNEALYSLVNIPFPDVSNRYFRALRLSACTEDGLHIYKSVLQHFPRNITGHDACLFNYSILLRDLGYFQESHRVARDRFMKNAVRFSFGRKPKQEKPGWVADAEVAMYDLKKALDKYDIEFFLISGTLLGCVRDAGIIGHDKDIDVGFDERYPVELVRKALEESESFKFFAVDYEDNVYVQHANGVLIDIFKHYMAEDGLYYHAGIKVSWWNTAFELVTTSFLGGQYLIPKDYETYLQENYGEWRTPVSDFETFVDTPNMKITNEGQLIWYYLAKLEEYYQMGKQGQFSRVWTAYSQLVDDPYLKEVFVQPILDSNI